MNFIYFSADPEPYALADGKIIFKSVHNQPIFNELELF